MNQLNLEPWEIPSTCRSSPTGKADDIFKALWRGKERTFLLRTLRLRDAYCTFACEQDSTAVGNWLVINLALGNLHVWSTLGRPTPGVFSLMMKQGQLDLARFCVVRDGKLTRRAATLANGESVWLSVSMGYQELFDLDLSEDDFLHNGRAHFEKLSEEMARPDSDARFAMRWLRWTTEKKQRHIAGADYVREVSTVMRSFLQSQEWLWEKADHWRWSLMAGYHTPSVPFAPALITHKADKQYDIFLAVAHLLIHLFQPSPDQSELVAHRCVREFAQWNDFWPTVEVSTPTHHERLEAHLYLREWLQRNAPDQMGLLLGTSLV